MPVACLSLSYPALALAVCAQLTKRCKGLGSRTQRTGLAEIRSKNPPLSLRAATAEVICAASSCERIRELEEGFVRKILGEVAGMKANREGWLQLF